MATSSITANFYTDDPKAANEIIHALFTRTTSSQHRQPKVEIVEFNSVDERKAFIRKALNRVRECQQV